MMERIAEKKRGEGEGGFTLIELLVVIIILGILAAVVVFAVGGVGDKGQAAACKIDTRTLRTAEEAYSAQTSPPGGGGSYGTEQQMKDGGFLSELSSLHQVVLDPAVDNAPTGPGPEDTPATFHLTTQDRGDGKTSCTLPANGAAGGTVNGTTIL